MDASQTTPEIAAEYIKFLMDHQLFLASDRAITVAIMRNWLVSNMKKDSASIIVAGQIIKYEDVYMYSIANIDNRQNDYDGSSVLIPNSAIVVYRPVSAQLVIAFVKQIKPQTLNDLTHAKEYYIMKALGDCYAKFHEALLMYAADDVKMLEIVCEYCSQLFENDKYYTANYESLRFMFNRGYKPSHPVISMIANCADRRTLQQLHDKHDMHISAKMPGINCEQCDVGRYFNNYNIISSSLHRWYRSVRDHRTIDKNTLASVINDTNIWNLLDNKHKTEIVAWLVMFATTYHTYEDYAILRDFKFDVPPPLDDIVATIVVIAQYDVMSVRNKNAIAFLIRMATI